MRKSTGFALAGILLVVMLFCGSVANAQKILSYSGQNIWNKASVNSGYVPGAYCTVEHTQSRVYGRNVELTVYMERQDGFFWTKTDKYTYYINVTRETNFRRNLSKGTYRLYFAAPSADQACDISGSFYY